MAHIIISTPVRQAPVGAKMESLHVVALWRFACGLHKKQWGVSGQCRRELPYIQRCQSGPVIALHAALVAEQQAEWNVSNLTINHSACFIREC